MEEDVLDGNTKQSVIVLFAANSVELWSLENPFKILI